MKATTPEWSKMGSLKASGILTLQPGKMLLQAVLQGRAELSSVWAGFAEPGHTPAHLHRSALSNPEQGQH